MNRRHFLSSLIALPVAPKVLTEKKPRKTYRIAQQVSYPTEKYISEITKMFDSDIARRIVESYESQT